MSETGAGALRGATARREAERRAERIQPDLVAAGVRRLALTFVNHAGAILVKVVPLARLAAVARDGVGFSPVSDAWTVMGVPDPAHPLAVPDGDLRLVPDLDQLLVLEGRCGWAWAPADRHDREGAPYPADQRLFCRAGRSTLERGGVTLRMGFELEWVVAEPGPDGRCIPAVSGGPYGADRLVEAADYAAALTDALDAAAIPWLQFHPEYGPGQFELSLAPADPVRAADLLVAARLLIQRVTRRFGWHASFSPLVDAARVGNGGHLHFSVEQNGRALLQGGEGHHGLSPEGAGLIGSLLEHLPALLPIACPLAVSYGRLGPARWSAPYRIWGVENREAALRLIPSGGDGSAAHLELKTADLGANPYLLVGAVLALVREGLARPGVLPDAVRGDPSLLPCPPERLPRTLAEASAAFAASVPLRDAMGPLLFSTLLESQRAEIRRAAPLDPEALIASCRWLPPLGEPLPG
jgi:glutamine synthetase